MMGRDRLRVGIVGCGGIARAHARGYRASGSADVTVVYDVSHDAAAALAAEIGPGVTIARSFEAIAASGVDAVSVCTPPGAHLESCVPFIRSGLAVLCEKPLERDAVRARKLAHAVQRHGSLFMTAFCHRFHPPVVELKRIVDSGLLGKPLFFRNMFSGQMPLEGDHRSRPTESGGGSLIDNASHSVDLFRHLVGEPVEVLCSTGNIAQDLPVEDFGAMILRSAGGAFGVVIASHSIPVGTNELVWYGSAGTAVVEYWDDLRYRVAQGAWVDVTCSRRPDRFELEIAHFVERVHEGASPTTSVWDGLAASLAVGAAYESAATGRRARVPSTGEG
jgi:predicted dehydrogenase